ncbi:MAG: hypothetical protein HZB39_02510 [Planctomycetes bacterium]|nr:hypothetical protein [Planctomycetota bacterium]
MNIAVVLAFSIGSIANGQQENWTLAAPIHSPPARGHAAMAYDEQRGVIVLFGGAETSGASLLGDTWEWDGTDWRRVGTTSSPDARRAHAMAYDPIRRRVVLFGGLAAQSDRRSDTWEYDGTNWTMRNTLPFNDGRFDLGMAFDPVRRQLIRFGGGGAGGDYGDTQAWTGSQWVLVGAGGPTPRSRFAMATDSVRDRIVLFGGSVDSGGSAGLRNDTWQWNGQSWQQVFPATIPPIRLQFAMAFDASTARVVAFGGQTASGAERQTWAFDGRDWTRRTTLTSPPAQLRAPLAYHAASDQVVLLANDGATWIYDAPTLAPATFATFGAGCPGGNGIPVLAASSGSLPYVGSPFRVELTGLGSGPFLWPLAIVGFSDSMWGSHALPLGLSSIGLPDCTLYVEVAIAEPMARVGDLATKAIEVPANGGLVGRDFWLQALVIDVGAAGGAALSNAGRGRIGAR